MKLGKNKRPKSTYAVNQIKTAAHKPLKSKPSFADKVRLRREAKAKKKAEYLATLPKSRIKRVLYRMHPKRVIKYWFSREGGLMMLKLAGAGMLIFFITGVSIFAYFRKDLPNLKDISGSNQGGSIQYYDRTGTTLLWEDFSSFKRLPVKDDAISTYMKDATVAIEDRDFYNHGGFNTRGIIRAALNNAKGGQTQGGSTITQQLVKLTQDWSKDLTIKRKIKELILAVELERSHTKTEILEAYLNIAPYGAFEIGVESASLTYFGKPAKELTLDEAAMLAAIPKSPTFLSAYSPDFDKEYFIERQHYIIDIMLEEGKITSEEAEQAKVTDTIAKVMPRIDKYENIKHPYFVLAARSQLVADKTETVVARGGWKVTTTLDLRLQQIAEEELAKGMQAVYNKGGDKAAFAAVDVPTGQVVALVGGQDFADKERAGEVNFAQRPLPPGSSFKPYDYLALIENSDKVGAGTVLYDTQGPIIDKETGTGYACTNKARPKDGGNCLWDYDFRYPGPVTLRYSLGGSRNVPAVKAMLMAGVNKTISTAESLGLRNGYKCYTPGTELFKKENESQCYASSAIGDGAYLYLDDHVSAYAAISRNGTYMKKSYYLKIEDQVNKNKIIDEWKQEAGEQVVRPDSAYIVADMMEDPNASYFPAGRKPHRYNGHKFAMKTGTTNDSKDGWMMGFSTYYSAGVWIGSHTGNQVLRGTMEDATQPIWHNFMKRAHDGLSPKERERPATVQTLDAYVIRNHVGIGSVEPSPAKDLFPSWYKQAKKGTATKRVIDTVSNKLATDCTPARAKKEVFDTSADVFSGDTFQAGSIVSDEKDDVHKCEDIRPTASLTVQELGGGTYRFTANFTGGTHALTTVNFLVDGQVVPNGSVPLSAGSTTASVDYTPGDGGSKSVTIEVIDAALYDATDSQTVSFSGTESFTLTTSEDGNKIRFSWSDVSGADEYEVCWGSCVNTDGSKNSVSVNKATIGNGSFTAKVTARKNGSTLQVSNSANFTVN